MLIAKVAVEKTKIGFDKLYSYRLNNGNENTLKPGMRVLVPFGRGNSSRQGMVFEIEEMTAFDEKKQPIKPIKSLLDREPIISPELLGLAGYLKANAFCTYYEALKVMLPPGVNFELIKKLEFKDAPNLEETVFMNNLELFIIEHIRKQKIKIIDKKKLLKGLGCEDTPMVLSGLIKKNILVESVETKTAVKDSKNLMVRSICDISSDELSIEYKISQKHRKVLDLLCSVDSASLREIRYMCSVSKPVVDLLVYFGFAEYFETDNFRNPYKNTQQQQPMDFKLTSEQSLVHLGISEIMDSNQAAAVLLHGITGSGKTQVYLKLIDKALNDGKTAIVMVPEIALTPQIIGKFHLYFGDSCAVIHSGLTLGERYDEYKRIKSGACKIVIGTRSAVFAPLENIGIIIMDEEHDSSYKSSTTPRYHAREAAKYRCVKNNAVLLMGSATPSVESCHYALNGRYKYFTLNKRYSTSQLPKVEIIDMNEEFQNGNFGTYSTILLQQLEKNIINKEQSILMLNRRGFNTIAICTSCSSVVKCRNCSVSLTYHKANNKLMCHYCGCAIDHLATCIDCGGKIRYTGAGTQKIQEELQELLPGAKIIRLDADTALSRHSYEQKFGEFRRQEADILVGTQMVAKGLDFPNVTLVGVLNADSMLYANDFRAYERTFALITQVVGRSGRAEKKGRAYIQSFTPFNDILEMAANQDYAAFFQNEINIRKSMGYPPFCSICIIGFAGTFENMVVQLANEFLDVLKKNISTMHPDMPIRIYGPVGSEIVRINRKYRYKIVIKVMNSKEFRSVLGDCMNIIDKSTLRRYVSVFADLNYDSDF